MRIIEPFNQDRDGHIMWNGVEYIMTRQERRVCELFAQGMMVIEIAEQLHLSAKTVSTYLYRIRDKLGLTSTQRLLAALIEIRIRKELGMKPNGAE